MIADVLTFEQQRYLYESFATSVYRITVQFLPFSDKIRQKFLDFSIRFGNSLVKSTELVCPLRTCMITSCHHKFLDLMFWQGSLRYWWSNECSVKINVELNFFHPFPLFIEYLKVDVQQNAISNVLLRFKTSKRSWTTRWNLVVLFRSYQALVMWLDTFSNF